MIRLSDVTKVYFTHGLETKVADQLNLCFPAGRSVGLLGRNGSGKSSLLRMIAGTMRPTSGHIEIDGAVSWPVGFAGSFHGDLTGLQNTRFVARIYGVDSDQLSDFVEDFAELGHHFRLPFRTYSQGMRARLGFAMSMGIAFDFYLIDEITSVGDAAFREKCEDMLSARLASAGAIIVSHNLGLLRRVCDAGVVIEDGIADWHDDVNAAIQTHLRIMDLAPG